MIKIGAVNIDTSHPLAFSDYLIQGDRARYTAVYNDGFRDDEEVQGFIGKYGLERRCLSIEELADCTDIGFIHSCNWDEHINQAMPFIERNKPVFIDKPIVGSPADCRRLEKLADDGAIILGSSSVRYAEEVVGFIAQPEQEKGVVMNIYGTAGIDEFNYAIHIVEAIDSIAGAAAVSARYIGRSIMEDSLCETFFISFANGVTATFNTFCKAWQPFEMVVMTTATTHRFRIDTGRIYGALLDRICDYMETGRSDLVTVRDLTHSVEIMLAARLSRENGGTEVNLSDIPENDPGYNGAAFEREYSAVARRLYA